LELKSRLRSNKELNGVEVFWPELNDIVEKKGSILLTESRTLLRRNERAVLIPQFESSVIGSSMDRFVARLDDSSLVR
jgi:uncharacterized protein with PIN domain